jgi:hypothetical protein
MEKYVSVVGQYHEKEFGDSDMYVFCVREVQANLEPPS